MLSRSALRARTVRVVAVVLGAAGLAVGGSAVPASAAINDSFPVSTGNGCGVVNFVDYGPGAPGGGDNDDYLVIHDYCADGYGVNVAAFIDKGSGLTYLGSKRNSNGLAGAPVIWDPFKAVGNVNRGDRIELEVCLWDGQDPYPITCTTGSRTSADG
jgi:hypothetical protein